MAEEKKSVLDRLMEEDKPETFAEADLSVLDRLMAQPTGRIGGPDAGRTVVQQIPQVLDAPEGGLSGGEAFKQGFIEDPRIRISRVADQMFPGDPEAIKRFGMVNGDIVFVNDDGALQKVSGGAGDTLGSLASLAPEVGGAVAGSFATGAPVVGSALGATAGQGLKQIIGGLFLDDPKTPMSVLQAMGIEFAADLLGSGVGQGFRMARDRKALSEISESAIKGEARRQELKDATGIELDLAQVTNLPKLRALKMWARNFPGEAGEIIRANDELIAGQVDEAVERLLDVVAKTQSPAAAGVRGMNAAQGAITGARANVADATQPLYRQAFGAVDEAGNPVAVDVDPVYDLIDEKLKTAKGGVAKTLREVRRYLNVAGTTQRDNSVEGLHGSKVAIDALLESSGSDTSVSRIAKREIMEVREQLLNQMSEASPAYKQANDEFARLSSVTVDPLKDGIIGVLAKMPNHKAASAAARMFNDGNVTPFEISLARTVITEQSGEEAWNGLVKQYLMNQFNRASREIQVGDEANLAGKFRQAVIGTRQQKQAMKEALGPEARELFDVTMEALQAVARTSNITSQSATSPMQLVTRELESNVGSAARAVMSPRATTIRGIEDRHLQQMSVQIAEALTDPAKQEQLKVLAEMPPNKVRGLIAGSVIGLSILPRDQFGDTLLPPSDIIPPAMIEQLQ